MKFLQNQLMKKKAFPTQSIITVNRSFDSFISKQTLRYNFLQLQITQRHNLKYQRKLSDETPEP